MEKEEVKKGHCCGNCNHEENIKEEKHECNCNDNCTCGDDCNCTENNRCTDNCSCGENCECGDDCKCEDNCTCGNKCHCNDLDNEFDESEEVLILKNNIQNLEEKLKASHAELINYRKRKDEEIVRMLKFCNEDLIKQILPIMDNFERAIKLDDDNLEDEVSKFLEGFKMIYCNMQNVMGNFDVKQIDGANKPFDPVYHNAIMVEQREGVEPGMVLEVLQKGYIYKDKVIRPAMVKVSE